MSIEVQSYYVDLKIKNSKAINIFFYYNKHVYSGVSTKLFMAVFFAVPIKLECNRTKKGN
jgi:hypothetical protein